MKELHAWAPWFRDLARTIAAGGEDDLIQKAKRVDWKNRPPLLKGPDHRIDPFSFLYTLASKNTKNQRPVAYPSADDIFDVESVLPKPTDEDLFVFPTPVFNVLFSPEGEHFALLWRLFRQAVGDDGAIEDSDYRAALAIPDVAINKLSHGLFLSNPYRFLPADDFERLEGAPAHVPAIGNSSGYQDYADACDCVRRVFPGCQPFEINYLFWNSGEDGWIGGKTAVFQVNGGGDLWPDFEATNSVRPSGDSSAFPLADPKEGDVVLVRDGETHGRAVGVVTLNDFAKNGGTSTQSRIHVSWINKASSDMVAGTESSAFDAAGPGSLTFRAFAGTAAYQRTFDLLKDVLLLDFDNGPTPSEKGSLNQILYGPPGTGKTWNTVARAVAIIERRKTETVQSEDRDSVKTRFEEYRKAGQVEMVAFHQNYAYEDFIEGIRPVVNDDTDGQMAFEMRHGVFRDIVERAARNLRESSPDDPSFDVDELIQSFLESVDGDLESGVEFPLDVPDAKTPILLTGVRRRKTGDINGFFLKRGGMVVGRALLVLRRDYPKFYSGDIASYKDIEPINKAAKGPWHSFARDHYGMMVRLKKYHDDEREREPVAPVARKNFVLVLDEINRGNIARIFGELITLVEESRRIGREDETKVTLPNSGEEFGVPENLYLIGTMNTADRSIALLDTALRRRFEFVEMMPDSSPLDREVAEVHLGSLLDAMNERIRFLRDREHQIGHTYFLEVNDLEGLRAVFQNRILPLLQEYFYDDWAKIEAVLGNNGFVESVEPPGGLTERGLVDKGVKSYELLRFDDGKWEAPASYRKIYEKPTGGGANGG